MTDKDSILFSKQDNIATITLNRPDSLNAMTNSLMKNLVDALALVEQDKTIRVVVLTGSGRGFCAGADLAGQASAEPSTAVPDGQVDDNFNGAMRAIYDCPVPTVARVNGAAAGGGFGLAVACYITVAAKSAFFVATFGPRRGIVPDLGTTWNLPRKAGRARALGLSLLGDRITAEQAESWGLIWKAVADEQLDAEVGRITNSLAKTSAETVTRIRSVTDAALGNSFSDQLDLEMVHQAVLIPRNMQEGAMAFMEKREPNFPGRE